MSASLYTLQDLDDLVLARLENNSVMWETAERYDIINECLQSINLVTGFYQGTAAAMISVAGQLIYAVPAGVLYPLRCQFESSQLDPVPITRIGRDYRTWTTDTTAKLGSVARWVPIGINYFAIHPADSLGGNSIFVTGVMETPVLVLPTDAISLEDQYVDLLVNAVYSRLPLKLSGPATLAALSVYQKEVLPSLKRLTVFSSMKWPKFFVQAGSPVSEGRPR